MEKYYKAGARYFMSSGASHHDHFFNYDSQLNRMNSVNVGPHKDILRPVERPPRTSSACLSASASTSALRSRGGA